MGVLVCGSATLVMGAIVPYGGVLPGDPAERAAERRGMPYSAGAPADPCRAPVDGPRTGGRSAGRDRVTTRAAGIPGPFDFILDTAALLPDV